MSKVWLNLPGLQLVQHSDRIQTYTPLQFQKQFSQYAQTRHSAAEKLLLLQCHPGLMRSNSIASLGMNIGAPFSSQLWISDTFSRRMWDSWAWQLLKIKWQFLMGFQTSASHCILPVPPAMALVQNVGFYLTGRGGERLFSELRSIRRPACSQIAF